MKSMIALFAALMISASAFAQVENSVPTRSERRGKNISDSSLRGHMRTSRINEQLTHVSTCEEGYNLTRRKLDNLAPSGEFMMFAGFGVHAFAYTLLGSNLGVLVYPAAALYEVGLAIKSNTFSKAEKVFIASRACEYSGCNLRPLVKIRNWLEKKHDIVVTNEEIANVVNAGSTDLELCTEIVREDGVRKMKPYKQLREDILKKLSVDV